jgi:hypothetical protein
MAMLVRAIRVLAWMWLFAACAVIVVASASPWRQGGFAALWELVSPHLVLNGVFVGLILAPALFLATLARGIQEKHRGKILSSAAALSVSVIAVTLITFVPVRLAKNETEQARQTGKAREYEAQSIRVKDQSATLYQYNADFTSPSVGPVGTVGIPESIQIGDAITVNGHTLRAQHILVKEILSDIKYDDHVLGKAGETQCIIVESLKNLPDADQSDKRDRLWIVVEKCVPIAAATQ